MRLKRITNYLKTSTNIFMLQKGKKHTKVFTGNDTLRETYVTTKNIQKFFRQISLDKSFARSFHL